MEKIILLEIRRQIAHLLFGIALTVLLFLDWIDLWFLTGLTLASFGLMFYWKTVKNEHFFFKKVLFFLERRENLQDLPGQGLFFYLLGVLLTVVFFPPKIALASIIILAVGDSISHLYGRFLGKVKVPFFPRKNVEGHVVATLLSAIAVATSVSLPFFPALAAATVGMISEIPCGKWGHFSVDDNLIIPIFSGLTLWFWNFFFPFL